MMLRILLGLTLILGTVHAEVSCPAIFGDHMILQREQPVPVWGQADAGEQISVEFAGQSARTTAGADGKWRVNLTPLKEAIYGYYGEYRRAPKDQQDLVAARYLPRVLKAPKGKKYVIDQKTMEVSVVNE